MSQRFGVVVLLKDTEPGRMDAAIKEDLTLAEVEEAIREVVAKATDDEPVWQAITIVRHADVEKFKTPPDGYTEAQT